jgi:hypothetical protein
MIGTENTGLFFRHIMILLVYIACPGLCYTQNNISSIDTFSGTGKYHSYLKGRWKINIYTFGSDTLFLRGNPSCTERESYKKNRDSILTKQDSIKMTAEAQENYRDISNAQLHFISDSTFLVTKARRGKLVLAEMDTGSYQVRNDSAFLTMRTRNNKKGLFKIDSSGKRLYLYDVFAEGRAVYMEYLKEDE